MGSWIGKPTVLRITTLALVLGGWATASANEPSAIKTTRTELQANATPVDRLEASVNASIILLSDVTEFRKTLSLRAQLDPLFSGTPLASRGADAADREIVEFLVNERLIADQFPVKDPEVEQEINSIQASNRVDRKGLEAALRQQGFAFSDYFEMIRNSISKRNLIDRDIRTKVHISDDDVKNYFYNQSKIKPSGLSYQIKIITVTPSNFTSATAAREVAERALQAARSGEKFEDVAKRFSDDASAQNGGELGVLKEDEISPEIRDTVKKLKVGETTPVLGSEKDRFFILKLADLRSGLEAEYEKNKEELRSKLTAQEYQHQLTLWIERERQKAFVHIAAR